MLEQDKNKVVVNNTKDGYSLKLFEETDLVEKFTVPHRKSTLIFAVESITENYH